MTHRPIRSAAVAVVLSLLGLALLGCFRLPDRSLGDDQAGTRRPTSSGTASSLEGRFSYETMDAYVEAVVPMIREWAADTWPQLPMTQVAYVPRGVRGVEDCLDRTGVQAVYTSSSYEYCGANAVIYVGQDMLWTFYQRTGDAGPAVGMAHEFGHHVQQQLGVPPPQSAQESTRHENQADCLAGAWVRYTDQKGLLEYPDDIEDINALFPLIGSAEGPGRDHGTADERLRAFDLGFSSGPRACNSFYPAVPVFS